MWQDIFDNKFKGETANDVYNKLVEVENQRQKMEIQEQKVVNYMKKVDAQSSESSSDVSGFSQLDDDEKELVEKIKNERIQAQKEYDALPKYGDIIEINHLTYKDAVQINNHVLVHISSDHLPECKRVNFILRQLADKFPTLKICKIDYKEANKDFPERNCPTLLVYSCGQVIKQFVGTFEIGGRNVTADDLEWKLYQMKVVNSDLE